MPASSSRQKLKYVLCVCVFREIFVVNSFCAKYFLRENSLPVLTYTLLFPSQGTSEALEEVGGMLVEKLPVFIQSGDLEVQERACCILQVGKN